METISDRSETKAIKEHYCNFCGFKIEIGEVYFKSTHKMDGEIYDWKTHKGCDNIATILKMYDNSSDCGYEGVSQDFFEEIIHATHDELLISKLPKGEIKKYGDIIRQLRFVRWKDKLRYVIQYYNNIDKTINPQLK